MNVRRMRARLDRLEADLASLDKKRQEQAAEARAALTQEKRQACIEQVPLWPAMQAWARPQSVNDERARLRQRFSSPSASSGSTNEEV